MNRNLKDLNRQKNDLENMERNVNDMCECECKNEYAEPNLNETILLSTLLLENRRHAEGLICDLIAILRDYEERLKNFGGVYSLVFNADENPGIISEVPGLIIKNVEVVTPSGNQQPFISYEFCDGAYGSQPMNQAFIPQEIPEEDTYDYIDFVIKHLKRLSYFVAYLREVETRYYDSMRKQNEELLSIRF